jgi:hypothetical protein
MSRHVPRHRRWNKLGPAEYTAGWAAVRARRGGWYAWVSYDQAEPGPDPAALPAWQQHCDQLGPFKRPRNAMIAAEDRAVLLERRHSGRVQLDCPVLKSRGGAG